MNKYIDKRKIGNVIKKARLDKNLTQMELSELAGISRNYISDIENGRYMPSVETLFQLAKCLEINLNIFLNDGNASNNFA